MEEELFIPVHNTLEFEVGDVVFCPYYLFTGRIVEHKEVNGIEYIILEDPETKDRCSTAVVHNSTNGLYPCYMQMICKKEAFDNIPIKALFSGISWGNVGKSRYPKNKRTE